MKSEHVLTVGDKHEHMGQLSELVAYKALLNPGIAHERRLAMYARFVRTFEWGPRSESKVLEIGGVG